MIKTIYNGEPEIGSVIDSNDIEAICVEIEKFKNPLYNHNSTIFEFESRFGKLIGNQYAIAINSCGTGIDMILKYLSLKDDDEVISSAINFHGTHLAILNTGAKLVLVNANDDLNIDVVDVERNITNKTKAIVVTHMNGLSCDMDKLLYVTRNKGIFVIEDAARALGGKYKGKFIGADSWACVYSFQYKKIITTLGEGGMIVTNNLELRNTLLQYRSFGMGNAWGTSYKMTSVQAAVGITQLDKLHLLIRKRRKLALQRTLLISKMLSDFKCPTDNDIFFNAFYTYTLLVPTTWNKGKRDGLIRLMKKKNVNCIIANPPTYEYNKYIFEHCENRSMISETIGNRIICLPIHPNMTEDENKYIIDSLVESAKKMNEF